MNDYILAEILRRLPTDRHPTVELSDPTKRSIAAPSSTLSPGEMEQARVVSSRLASLSDPASAVRVINRLAHLTNARMYQWDNHQEQLAKKAYADKASEIIDAMRPSLEELALSDELSKVLWRPA